MTGRVTVGVALTLLGTLVGCVQVLRHDQEIAAQKATAFLTAAVVRQDYEAAYQMVREEDRPTVSQAGFTEAVKASHPSGFPTEVRAMEYEPVPGQAAIQIFLVGKNDKETFYYRVPLVGTVTSGYFPQGLFRGNKPYPPSALRQALKG